jgi:release factor glutamine methyltransferase
MTTCGEVLRNLTTRLREVDIPSARLDARLLLAHALGVSATTVFSHPERVLTADEQALIEALAVRRAGREPVSHILGQREFWSLSFKVTADTLDPRPDTETVIDAVLAAVADRQAPLRLLDFGTGSGCILLALLSELPQASGLGVDASPAALAVAEYNARSLGLDHRAIFASGDWGRGIDGLFDVIVSNPPYIRDEDIDGLEAEVAGFEPRGALAGGPDGLDCYRALAPDVKRLLDAGGTAVFEVGQGQAKDVAEIMQAVGLVVRGMRCDLGGIERCVIISQSF